MFICLQLWSPRAILIVGWHSTIRRVREATNLLLIGIPSINLTKKRNRLQSPCFVCGRATRVTLHTQYSSKCR